MRGTTSLPDQQMREVIITGVSDPEGIVLDCCHLPEKMLSTILNTTPTFNTILKKYFCSSFHNSLNVPLIFHHSTQMQSE